MAGRSWRRLLVMLVVTLAVTLGAVGATFLWAHLARVPLPDGVRALGGHDAGGWTALTGPMLEALLGSRAPVVAGPG